ncbi:MAG: ABC transporter substrate-binding protein [Acetobacteraceae bacterium]|jgi:phospholipid transport system substrate-binding protein
MPLASFGRRRWLQVASAWAGAFGLRRAWAQSGLVAPIKDLCDALLRIMKAGSATPFAQRFAMLAPVIDRVFNLSAILQVSVGPAWSTLDPDQHAALLTAFRRYTIANYVNSFNNFTGQHFDVVPEVRSLPNGEQLVQTRITSASGESHDLDYVMRADGGPAKVVDVLADGSISRVAVQRSDFRRLVARGGAQALIDSLNQKTNDLSGGASLP